ncbi:hypothetical protein WG908_02695 [Sphingobium sp. AN641]|uniref:hypothetical protein n=1 Tax=Sphingobium sp. AN641 TaxID=3133443 RepID=UPI0030C431A4
MWLPAGDTLRRLADLGEEEWLTFVLENLNAPLDHPGVPFDKASECLNLIASIERPSLRLMPALYHAQIGEGNFIELCRQVLSYIGEINYSNTARALATMGYDGPVGLEAWASGDLAATLDCFPAAFTVV